MIYKLISIDNKEMYLMAFWTYAVGFTGNDDAPPELDANDRTDPALVVNGFF